MQELSDIRVESPPKISEYMDTEVPTLRSETRLMEAVDFLLDHQVTGAPVVDPEKGAVGIISESDLLKLVTEGISGEPPAELTVAEYMSTDVITVPPTVDIQLRRRCVPGKQVQTLARSQRLQDRRGHHAMTCSEWFASCWLSPRTEQS